MRVGPAAYEGSESRIDFAAGARVEKLKGGGWGLGIPEETRPIIRRMAANYCDFTSMAKIPNFANFSEEIALIKAVERGLDNARVLTRRLAGSVPVEVGKLLKGKSENSARDHFYYYSSSTRSAVRYKNWKICYTMSKFGATACWIRS